MSELIPAAELAARNTSHFPNEDETYRKARNALLIKEIELRRQIEAVAGMRRSLPPGGAVPRDYAFVGPNGPVTLSGLFGDKDTLVIYSFMFGPQRKAPCPMCTSMIGSWEGKIEDIRQRVAVAVIARSPIERLLQWKIDRGWKQMPFYSDMDGDFTRDYVSAEDADMPGYTVFTRKDGVIRHFWSEEISFDMADPGQDPRGAVEQDALWLLLDTTPEGRGSDWHPSLSYGG
ncbi:DUF899 family protein [Martelella mediterranea]|uniref:Uncharacterized protein n=1 Tax=Martelella mediterranea DSM 17316 TaxID=1122214 RepID=A0A1U9Z4R2_9HYPH|nr:DUF899 family protein [Martelella mediterranea]AQZ52654.1 hypothetical protein Mame_03347 [Martelella mediterranea DSM 17316]